MIATVHAVAKGGAGVIRLPDQTVFVPGVIAGETVEFSIHARQQGIGLGKLLRVLEPSPWRVEAPCRHYPDCGGCNLQHMDYQEQVRCKKEILVANLKKIAAFVPGSPVDLLPSPAFRYRSKIELQVHGAARGFFQKKSHRIVPIDQCLLLSEAAERFVMQIPPLPQGTNGVLQLLDNGRELSCRLQKTDGAIHWLTDQRTLFYDFSGHRFRSGPENFIQANIFQMEPMLELLWQSLPAEGGDTAADLFCGCGFFTLPLSRRFRRVLAMDNNPGNLAALRTNLGLNQITHVETRAADALQTDLPPLQLVVLDPPRGGLSGQTIARVHASGAGTVIYFSCDSASFARDLRLFIKKGYHLRQLQLIDNFPQTDHFEIFSVLDRQGE